MAARGPVDKRGCSHETAQLAETNYPPPAQLAFPRGIVHKQVDYVDSFNSFERYLRRIAFLAWNAPFRSRTEQMLWRISAPVIMGYGFLLVAWTTFASMDERNLNNLDIITTLASTRR